MDKVFADGAIGRRLREPAWGRHGKAGKGEVQVASAYAFDQVDRAALP